MAQCDARIAHVAQPLASHIDRLQTIVGVGRRSAEVIVSEIGVDMSRFASSAHVASWARLCPGTHESAGKRRSAGTGGSARRCSNRRGRPPIRAAVTWAPSIVASVSDGDPSGPRLRRLTAFR